MEAFTWKTRTRGCDASRDSCLVDWWKSDPWCFGHIAWRRNRRFLIALREGS